MLFVLALAMLVLGLFMRLDLSMMMRLHLKLNLRLSLSMSLGGGEACRDLRVCSALAAIITVAAAVTARIGIDICLVRVCHVGADAVVRRPSDLSLLLGRRVVFLVVLLLVLVVLIRRQVLLLLVLVLLKLVIIVTQVFRHVLRSTACPWPCRRRSRSCHSSR